MPFQLLKEVSRNHQFFTEKMVCYDLASEFDSTEWLVFGLRARECRTGTVAKAVVRLLIVVIVRPTVKLLLYNGYAQEPIIVQAISTGSSLE